MVKEKELIDKFIKTTSIRGKFEVEKTIPKVEKIEGKEIVRHTISNIYSFRIDLFIAENNGDYWIIEAKRKLDPRALGQLLVYKELFCERFNIDPSKVKLGAIYHIEEPSLNKIFEKYGIKLFKV